MQKFKDKAEIVHNSKYDYSLTEYVQSNIKVIIVCSIHGQFTQTPNMHLRGRGCPDCRGQKISDTRISKSKRDFAVRARLVHGDKYDYSLVDYKGANQKVIIVCSTHGQFTQTPGNHLYGYGCNRCADSVRSRFGTIKGICSRPKIAGSYSIVEFVAKSKEVHGETYDYSLAKYIDSITRITIICPTHGQFKQVPSNHMRGQGCPLCGHIKASAKKSELAKRKFSQNASIVHSNKYDYSLANYVKSDTKVIIVCPSHGQFTQTPNMHLSGSGCPQCKKFKPRKEI